MQGMSLEQEGEIFSNHALFSWMEGEDAMFTNDTSTSQTPQVQLDYFTRSKRRLTREHVLVIPQPKPVPQKSLEPLVVVLVFQKQSEATVSKAKESKPQIAEPLNVVEQLKKAPTHVSLWDILAIPKQKTLLQEALEED